MANSYLNRTGTTGTADYKMTYSAWFKRGNIGSGKELFCIYKTNSNRLFLRNNGDTFELQISGQSNSTTRVFRDVSAWYHLVIAVDTTQATQSDRIKWYVNGEQISDGGSTIGQNTSLPHYSSGANYYIGNGEYNSAVYSNYWDGYMSHVAFVDGSALAPTVFGQTDSTSGIWKFKSPTGVTWGNNGFHLKFENSGNLGLDSSGQTNNFTVNGNLKQAVDNPSNVYATMNPLYKWDNVMNYSDANTSLTGTGSNWQGSIATLGVSAGKWYYEAKFTSATSLDNWYIGFNGLDDYNTSAPYRNGVKFYNYDGGEIYVGDTGTNGSTSANYGTFSNGDIIGIALDYDNETISVYKNGSAIVTNYDYGSQTYSSTIKDGKTISPCVSHYGTGTISFNFGNGFFGTTAITSAGSNGNGSLFEYDVPSGFYALNTKNINTYG